MYLSGQSGNAPNLTKMKMSFIEKSQNINCLEAPEPHKQSRRQPGNKRYGEVVVVFEGQSLNSSRNERQNKACKQALRGMKREQAARYEPCAGKSRRKAGKRPFDALSEQKAGPQPPE